MNLLQRGWHTWKRSGVRGFLAALARHAGGLWDRASDRTWDWRLGIETSRLIEVEDLSAPAHLKRGAMRYQPTGGRAFRRAMRVVQPGPDDVLVDFGCGKGRVLLLAARYPFRAGRGVEFSPPLAEAARAHAARAAHEERIEVITGDAGDYAFRDDETVIFLYNPFGPDVLERVLARLLASVGRKPRSVWLVYHQPEFAAVVERTPGLRLVSRVLTGHRETRLYRLVPGHKGSGPSPG
mgnify:CR=1 FL=1